jgi:nicotinate-nucleotide pyrophosphorylase (carboxylating)
MGLYDAVLIKDNHIEVARMAGLSLAQVLAKFQKYASTGGVVQIETRTLDEVRECIDAGANMILLDNMDINTMRQAVELGAKSGRDVVFEASGNVNLNTVGDIARTGVQRISVGAITHSAPALYVSLDIRMRRP